MPGSPTAAKSGNDTQPTSGSNLHKIGLIAVSLEEANGILQTQHARRAKLVFLNGWFKDTLPHAPIEKLAILRSDRDMYELYDPGA